MKYLEALKDLAIFLSPLVFFFIACCIYNEFARYLFYTICTILCAKYQDTLGIAMAFWLGLAFFGSIVFALGWIIYKICCACFG